jgi:Domain of unknown function (DUF4282)
MAEEINANELAGRFSSLLDFSFNTFITISIVKILYILGMVGIVLGVLGFIGAGFANGFVSGLVFLIISPIVALLWLLMLRVWLEMIVVIFRIAQNTTVLAKHATGQVVSASEVAGGTAEPADEGAGQ